MKRINLVIPDEELVSARLLALALTRDNLSALIRQLIQYVAANEQLQRELHEYFALGDIATQLNRTTRTQDDEQIELWCALFDLLIAQTDLSLDQFVDMAIDAYQRKSSQ